MKDYIPEKPVIQSSSLSDDTIIYRASSPKIRIFELNLLEEIGLILNFRQSSLKIAREIIRRQGGENVSFSITDSEYAEKIWPSLPDTTRERKFKRGKANLKEDQQLSNWRFAYIAPRVVIEKDGKYSGSPTIYKPGDYWNASDVFQAQTSKIDIFALNVRERHRILCEILPLILADFGAKRIENEARKKAEKTEKQKDGEKNLARIEKLRRQPNEVYHEWVDVVAEEFNRRLCDVGEINKEFGFRVKSLMQALEIEVQRARETIVKTNKAGLKLVGGQPK